MISHIQILAVEHGVRATLVVPDALETVSLFVSGLIDNSLHSSVHERPLCREQSARIPSVCVAEISYRSQPAYISQSEDPDLPDQLFFQFVMHIKKE